MAAKKNKTKSNTKPGYDYIVSELTKDKKASYGEIAAAAKKKGLSVYPIMYGRAKAALGLVSSKPRGQGKSAMAKKNKGVAKRGPGRPRKNVATTYDGSIASIVAAVKGSEQAKERYRGALEKIQTILADALA